MTMSLLVLHSVKSAGVTTTALLLAVLAAELRPVLVECDPAGGDVAARRGLPTGPGLAELATLTRSGERRDGDVLRACAQTLMVGDRAVEVVVAPPGGAATRVALGLLARPGQAALRPADRLVIADAGRFDGGGASPTGPLLAVADAVWLLVRGRLDELGHLREHLPGLVRTCGPRLTVVLAAGGVYGVAEVADALSTVEGTVTVAGPLPYDEATARLVNAGGRVPRGWLRRPLPAALSSLLRSAGVTGSPTAATQATTTADIAVAEVTR